MLFRSLSDLHSRRLISDHIFVTLSGALDEFYRLQGAVKRIKNYPYARNFYSISLLLLKAFIGIIPFGLFPYFQDLGRPFGGEYWTAWFCVPFSVFVDWVFMTLEKVGENSSNPFEGGPNDVPISFLARRIEIDMRLMLGEQTDLKPVEAKYGILF